jgi:hypothetical protein
MTRHHGIRIQKRSSYRHVSGFGRRACGSVRVRWWVGMVVRFVCVISVPVCVRAPRVCPVSRLPRCFFTGTGSCVPCVSRLPPVSFYRVSCVRLPPVLACLLPPVFLNRSREREKFASSQNEFVQNKVHGLRALRAVTDHDGLICSDSGSCPSSSGRSPWQEARLLLRRDYLHRAGASTHANPSLDGGVGSSRRRGGRGKG